MEWDGHGEVELHGYGELPWRRKRCSGDSGIERWREWVQRMRNYEAILVAKGIELGSCGGGEFHRWSKSGNGGAERGK